MRRTANRSIIRTLEKDERQIVKEIAEEMGKTKGEIRRILFGRKNGKMNWEVPE